MKQPMLLFDWGNTIMVDFCIPGPMYLWEEIAWVPFAEEALQELSRDYSCYMATNAGRSDKDAVLKALRRVGAERYFRGIFTSTDIGHEKPDPEFFQAICRELSADPASCIMIGDHYLKDIAGAKAFGMHTVWYNRQKELGTFPLADRMIFSMNELIATIRTL